MTDTLLNIILIMVVIILSPLVIMVAMKFVVVILHLIAGILSIGVEIVEDKEDKE